jgi:hypothetical protein
MDIWQSGTIRQKWLYLCWWWENVWNAICNKFTKEV